MWSVFRALLIGLRDITRCLSDQWELLIFQKAIPIIIIPQRLSNNLPVISLLTTTNRSAPCRFSIIPESQWLFTTAASSRTQTVGTNYSNNQTIACGKDKQWMALRGQQPAKHFWTWWVASPGQLLQSLLQRVRAISTIRISARKKCGQLHIVSWWVTSKAKTKDLKKKCFIFQILQVTSRKICREDNYLRNSFLW